MSKRDDLPEMPPDRDAEEWDRIICRKVEFRRKEFLELTDKLKVGINNVKNRSLGDMALHAAVWNRLVHFCTYTGINGVKIKADELLLLCCYYQYGPMDAEQLTEITHFPPGTIYNKSTALEKRHFVMLYGTDSGESQLLHIKGLTPHALIWMHKLYAQWNQELINGMMHQPSDSWEQFDKKNSDT